MIPCTLHPTGSLRSKILKNLDTSLIPSVAKKIDKKSYKGRLIFCKPYVPKTPKKESNPTAMQENPPAIRNEQETTLETNPKAIIPGITEADRLKAVKPNEKRNRKPKQRKSKSIDAWLDIKTLRVMDFLKENTKNELLKDYEFKDTGNEDDAADDELDDSNEELEDISVFSTPLAFKSNFGRIVAQSESRPRSKSVSTKRNVTYRIQKMMKTRRRRKVYDLVFQPSGRSRVSSQLQRSKCVLSQNRTMIDLNIYRQRIGTFKQPVQKKTSFMHLRESRKENPEYFRHFMRCLLLCLTVIISLSLHAENPWFKNNTNETKLGKHHIWNISTLSYNLRSQFICLYSSKRTNLYLYNQVSSVPVCIR